MLDNLLTLTNLGWLAGGVLFLVLFRLSNTVRYIPSNRAGAVERLWSFRGSIESGFIALRGEAGYQAHVLRGGWHLFTPFQYRVHVVRLVNIPQGKLGYLFARSWPRIRRRAVIARPDSCAPAHAPQATTSSGRKRRGSASSWNRFGVSRDGVLLM